MILSSVKLLERRYSSKLENGLGDNKFHMNTGKCNDGIYDWFPMVQRFTRSFLRQLFDCEALSESRVVLDSFMGSGNTLLACFEHGKIGYGFDVSPLFWFVAHVKTTTYSKKDFVEAINFARSQVRRGKEDRIPSLSSFRRLFDEERLSALLTLKESAYDLSPNSRELFLFALVSELLTFSYAKRYGKGLHLDNKKKLPPTSPVLVAKLEQMKEEYEEFYQNNSPSTSLYPLCGDSRDFDTIVNPLGVDVEVPSMSKADCIVTSPPYCNSADYIEMYKLEHWFLDFVKSYEDFKALSYSTIRSHTTFSDSKTSWKHEVIEDICSHLEGQDKASKIPNMIRGYFDDLHTWFGKVKSLLRSEGTVYLVVANSCYGEKPIPTDLLLAEAADDEGLSLKRINVLRNIMTSGQQWRDLSLEDKKLLRESMLILKAIN